MRHLTILPYSRNLKFAIIDGFSGGGLYKDIKGQEILGSPLRVLETVERLKKEITFERENKNFGKINFDIPIIALKKTKEFLNS